MDRASGPMIPGHLGSMLLTAMLGAAGILPCLTNAEAATEFATEFKTEKVADGIYLFSSGKHRSLFVVGNDGVIVTDPVDATKAKAYRTAISQITDLPVTYVVYSHYHWDRIAGGQIFADEGARFVAQRGCAERLRVYPNPDVVTPDITFTDRLSVSAGNISLELHYFGPAHGDCLTVFLVEPANLMQIVEMVNPPRAAFPRDPNVPHIKPHNLREFFDSVASLAHERGVKYILSSSVHAPGDTKTDPAIVAPTTGAVTLITDQAQFWNSIFRTVEVALAEGNVDLDSFVDLNTIDLELYQPYAGYEPTDLPVIMRRFTGFYAMGR